MNDIQWRRVIMPPECLLSIRKAAVSAYPAECCGLLVGHPKNGVPDVLRVTRVAPSVNLLATEQPNRFEVDPQLRFRLMRELRGSPERIVGHYHSHPDGPAMPSAQDFLMAYEPDLAWLIISVSAEQGMDAAIFLPSSTKSGFVPLPMTVLEPPIQQ